MERCVVLLLSIILAKTLSQPVTEETRKSRQLDFGECCPCPKPNDFDQQSFTRASYDIECPCRGDSDTGASILSPALQAFRPFIASNNKKEELIPLLNPEVGLASSVLETLREVTDEEYEDALARDAARTAVKAIENDLFQPLESPGSVINIILNPKDAGIDHEVEPQGSHIQETRCVHPLGAVNDFKKNDLKLTYPRLKYSTISDRYRLRNKFDMDNGASNIQEIIQKPSKSFNLKSWKLESNQNSLEESQKEPLATNSAETSSTKRLFPKIPDLKLPSILDLLKKPTLSKPGLRLFAKKNEEDFDNNNAPSFRRNIFSRKEKESDENVVQSYHPIKALKPGILKQLKTPMTLKNILKLKDVELIPPKTFYAKNNDELRESDKVEHAKDSNGLINKVACDVMQSSEPDAVPSPSEMKVTNISSSLNESPDSFTKTISIDNVEGSNELNAPVVNEDRNSRESEELSHNIEHINNSIEQRDTATDECNLVHPGIHRETKEETFSENFNDPKTFIIKNDSDEIVPLSSIDKNVNDSKSGRNMLPSMRADILKNFENFKKDNDIMQEKLRQNVQDVLQLVDTSSDYIKNMCPEERKETTTVLPIEESPSMNENESPEITADPPVKANESPAMTLNDLQEMSDSILNLSNKKNVVEDTSGTNESIASKKVVPADSEGSQTNNVQNTLLNNVSETIISQPNTDETLDDVESNSNIGVSKDDCTYDIQRDDFGNFPSETNDKNSNSDTKSSISDTIETMNAEERQPNSIEKGQNEMCVEASEPIMSRAPIVQPRDFPGISNIFKPKKHESLAFKPFSAKISTPDSLNRNIFSSDLVKNTNSKLNKKLINLGDINKNDKNNNEISLTKNNNLHDILFNVGNKPSTKAKVDPIKQLNEVLGINKGSRQGVHKNIFEDALSTGNDLGGVLSRTHNDLNEKLQALRMDLNDRLQSFHERINNLNRPNFNKVKNSNKAFGEKNIYSVKKKDESKLKQSSSNKISEFSPKLSKNNEFDRKKQFENIFTRKEKFDKHLNINKQPLGSHNKPQGISTKFPLREQKLKPDKMGLSTTTQPISILPPKKPKALGISSEFPRKTQLSKLKNAEPLNKYSLRITDPKTLSSNVDPVKTKPKSKSLTSLITIPDSNEKEPLTFNDQRFGRNKEHNERNQLKSKIKLPTNERNQLNNHGMSFPLKAEETSVLYKLLEALKKSHPEIDKDSDCDVKDLKENLGSPSQNVEKLIEMEPIREKTSYKCKMMCVKDD